MPDFPNSPNTGDKFSFGGSLYEFDGSKWIVIRKVGDFASGLTENKLGKKVSFWFGDQEEYIELPYQSRDTLHIFDAPQQEIVTDNLILHFDAGDTNSYPGTGTTWFDISGNNNNATLINNPTFSSDNSGIFIFNGTSQYASLPRPSAIVNNGDITIDMWVKWETVGTTTSTIQVLIDNNHATSQGFFIQDRPDLSQILQFGTGNSNNTNGTQSTFKVGDNTWRNVIVTNAGSSSMYINGVLNSQSNQGRLSSLQTTVNIARWVNGGRFLNGSIASVRIYDRALSAIEVEQNFNATKERFNL